MFRGIGRRGHIQPNRPLFVSITSRTDTATSGWFPLGTFFPNLFARRHYNWEKKRGPSSDDVNQHEYLTTTPGHNKRLFTHRIVPVGEGNHTSSSVPFDIRQPGTCVLPNPAFEENLRHPQGMQFVTSRRDAPDQLDSWQIEPEPGQEPTPYWVLQVPREIIHGHAPIFTPEGRAMMAALFRITNPKDQPGPRKMQLSGGRD